MESLISTPSGSDLTITGSPATSEVPTSQIWEIAKPFILRYYIDEDKTLKEVQRLMIENHKFPAHFTNRMYKARFHDWGVDRKKIRHCVYVAMHRELLRRRSLRKATVFSVVTAGGRKEISSDYVEKEAKRGSRRKAKPLTEEEQALDAERLAFADIKCFTPPPQFPQSSLYSEEWPSDETSSDDDYDENSDADVTSILQELARYSIYEDNINKRIATYAGFDSIEQKPRRLNEAAGPASQWVLHYIAAALFDEDEKNWARSHHERREGLRIFEAMLRSSNRYILPSLNWMTSMMISHGHDKSYLQFLQECRDKIHAVQGSGLTYAAPYEYALAVASQDKAGIRRHGESLQRCQDQCRLIWNNDNGNPNYLVLSYFLAWHLLENGRPDVTLKMTQDLLPQSEKVMGEDHLLTVNCLAIRSRAFAACGNRIQSLDTITAAVEKCRRAIGPGNQFTLKLVCRLADMQKAIGPTRFPIAQVNYEEVLHGRLRYFGIAHRFTSAALNDYEEILRLQGKDDEAHFVRQYYASQMPPFSEEEWRRLNTHEASA